MGQPSTDRRQLLTSLAGVGAMTSLVGIVPLASAADPQAGPASPGEHARGVEALGRVPWPYQPLDAEAAGRAAFQTYQQGLCMRGVFEGVVGQLASRLGPPFTAFPFAMFSYGAGGASGWGALCGTLNGAAAAISLLAANPAPLVAALFAWYEREALPDFAPAGTRFPVVSVAAGSVLCHASVAAWCRASGKPVVSAERVERCGLLAASVARKTVLLLNGGAAPAPSLDGASGSCLACHGRGGKAAVTMGRMRCAPCHTPAALGPRHPRT